MAQGAELDQRAFDDRATAVRIAAVECTRVWCGVMRVECRGRR